MILDCLGEFPFRFSSTLFETCDFVFDFERDKSMHTARTDNTNDKQPYIKYFTLFELRDKKLHFYLKIILHVYVNKNERNEMRISV